MYYERKTYNRDRQPVTTRRGNRSAMRFRHRQATGRYALEPDCQHDLTGEPTGEQEPPQPEPVQAVRPADMSAGTRRRLQRKRAEARKRPQTVQAGA